MVCNLIIFISFCLFQFSIFALIVIFCCNKIQKFQCKLIQFVCYFKIGIYFDFCKNEAYSYILYFMMWKQYKSFVINHELSIVNTVWKNNFNDILIMDIKARSISCKGLTVIWLLVKIYCNRIWSKSLKCLHGSMLFKQLCISKLPTCIIEYYCWHSCPNLNLVFSKLFNFFLSVIVMHLY